MVALLTKALNDSGEDSTFITGVLGSKGWVLAWTGAGALRRLRDQDP